MSIIQKLLAQLQKEANDYAQHPMLTRINLSPSARMLRSMLPLDLLPGLYEEFKKGMDAPQKAVCAALVAAYVHNDAALSTERPLKEEATFNDCLEWLKAYVGSLEHAS